ncbi:hypothetical protein M3689_01005 [Alkalihalophilus marmarensis]|uniref:hypothetical protein n=1 Tax=Alkalihalophilus marmarensis TaxID=521377 RepID=UPI00204090F6|nr:hypothetical protein [Alkalihalophilus marmarensis]MCM3487878.1 hypothetical protein [Alkalihalophilus marmarensis]
MEDIQGFKRGLEGIMVKRNIVALHGQRGSFIGYLGGKESAFITNCSYTKAILPGAFRDIMDIPEYDVDQITKDFKVLFDYYQVRLLRPQYLETFFIGPDDNNQFLMANVDIEFFEKKEEQKL